MSIWSEALPSGYPVLTGTEGELVSVSIAADPRLLEELLEVLAELPFPVNPQIYHDVFVPRVHPDGPRRLEPTTIVEFPAYAGRLPEIRGLLEKRGLDQASVWAKSMLEQIRGQDYNTNWITSADQAH